MVHCRKKMLSCLIVIIVCVLASSLACAEDASKVLVTVGQERITQADLDARTAMLPPQIRSRFETPAGRKQLLDQVVLICLLSQEARRLGIEQQEDVAKRIKDAVDNIIVQELTRQQITGEIAVPDGEIKSYYNENKKDFIRPEQVNTSVIMFAAGPETEADVKEKKYKTAQETLKRLNKGADFKDVAKEVSEDKRTQRRGGKTGFFARGRREKIYGHKFEEAAFALKKGEMSDVVETEFGYFIIRLDDRQPRIEETLDAARPRIVRRLQQTKQREAYENYVEGLKEKYPVKYSE